MNQGYSLNSQGIFSVEETGFKVSDCGGSTGCDEVPYEHAGSYNVYGKGVNAIGEFNLMGTTDERKTGGQVELYVCTRQRVLRTGCTKDDSLLQQLRVPRRLRKYPFPCHSSTAIPSSSLPGHLLWESRTKRINAACRCLSARR
jgi:hypothetical protein